MIPGSINNVLELVSDLSAPTIGTRFVQILSLCKFTSSVEPFRIVTDIPLGGGELAIITTIVPYRTLLQRADRIKQRRFKTILYKNNLWKCY